MSDSLSVEDLEVVNNDNVENGSFEKMLSPSLYLPQNLSPNTSITINDGEILLETDQGTGVLREDVSNLNIEDQSTSEMPSYLCKPSEFTDLDAMESQQILKDDEVQPIAQLEQEAEYDNGIREEGLDDTITSPHPARQVEEEIQEAQLARLYLEQVNPDGERTSNFRQRITPMPTDPAEDTRDPKMVRFN